MDEEISNFVAITNADPQVARGFLDMSNGNLEAALQLFFESPELQNNFGAVGSASVPPSVPANTRPAAAADTRGGAQDRPIEIDSDDDNVMFEDDGDDDTEGNVGSANAARVARNAQEEEDAAMAKRLQEELYGGGPAGAGGGSGSGPNLDDVRSPIRATRETLVDPSGFGGGFGDGEEEEDVTAIIQQQMRQRQAARARAAVAAGGRGNPFSHEPSIWDSEDPPRASRGPAASSSGEDRSQRLAELFRPPFELLEHYEWDEARALGKEDKKWIMVNFQDNSIFQCQMLNRDIWKDKAIAALVKENFIFLQYTKNSLDAQQFMTFYFPANSHENPDNFPHVSIVDPRTGEQVKIWSGVPFPTASDFHAQLAEFLDRYSLDVSKKNPVAKDTPKRPKVVDVDRMTEEEMLEMALQNSMASANGDESTPQAGAVDPDSLTKAALSDAQPESSGAAVSAVPAPQQSPFASIASDQPHVEPENNPATTTRIQFRHPSGRVIRRFRLEDPVRRIYEWLKAEPLEGKEGVDFELKQMPQGQDLMASLDGTIAEAGLKQGTVMIEFIAD